MTEIELLHEINECKKWHDAIKQETIGITQQIEDLQKIVNEKIKQLESVEKNYVDLLKELTNRQ
jgi:hypothetical protein